MGTILIKGGEVWDGERFLFADVLVRDGKVKALAPDVTAPADFVYDACGRIVSAGFVDAHVHLRGISSTEFDMPAEATCFPFGVTAAADASGVHGDRALLDSLMLKTAVFVCANFQNNRADFSKAEEMLKRYGDRAVGIKVYFDTTVSEVSDVTPLQAVCAFARDKGLRVMVHCSHSPVPMEQILQTLGKGDILTHAFHGGENNASEDAFASMKAAQARGVIIDAGFAGHVHTDFAVFAKALQSGILPDLISTDVTRYSAYTRGGRYGMTMCINLAKACGMKREDILRAITSNPARALGKSAEWGHLRVGGCADIAVLEAGDEGFDLTDAAGNRVASSHGYRCVLTLSDGQTVYRH